MSTYSTGTITVGVTSTSVAGQGTAWISAGVRPGDLLMAAGLTVPIATVVSNTQLTLARPWPGSALSAVNHDVLLVDDSVRALVAINTLIQTLGNGNLTSLAALAGSANKLPYFSGANVLALSDLTTQARGLLAGTALSRSGTTYTLNGTLNGTAVTQSPTDATASRLLKTGDFGLGGVLPLITNISAVDNSITTGLYAYDTALGSSGGPAGVTRASLLHTRRAVGGGETQQLVVESGTGSGIVAGTQFNRSRVSGAWTDWRLPGVVETASNANGRYTRYRDGTQICWQLVTTSTADDVAAVFPAAFSFATDLRTACSVNASALIALTPRFTGRTTTGMNVSCFNASNTRVATAVEAITIGRWY